MERRMFLKAIIGTIVSGSLPIIKSTKLVWSWAYNPPIKLKAGISYVFKSSGVEKKLGVTHTG